MPYDGIPNLTCPYLTGRTLEQPTMYDVWKNELVSYLAKGTPEQQAEADRQNRVTHIEVDKCRYREALVRQAAQEKLDAMLAEKYG